MFSDFRRDGQTFNGTTTSPTCSNWPPTRSPDPIALIHKRRQTTYPRARRAGDSASPIRSRQRGSKARDHVGILATNCIEWVEVFAIYKIRASAVNVNFRYVEEELRYLFENSDMVGIVYQRVRADRGAT